MVWGVLPLLTYLGMGSGALLLVVSLAAGLYYLAELIEVDLSYYSFPSKE